MISGFCQNGNASEALDVLDEMRFEGMKMDCVTVSTILPACAQMDDILRGMLIHLYIIKHGLEFDVFVSNASMNMYAKFGNIWQAQKVFNQMFVRDFVSWNSIIAAYEQNTHPDTALKFYGEMQSNGIHPDVLTLVSLVSSVAQSRNCRSGRVFGEIRLEDVVSWNTLITGYGQNGLASEAIEVLCKMEACEDVTPNQGTWLFQAMQDEGVKPDHITFVSLLSACRHSGLVGQGQWCFRVMQEEYGIEPSLKHYGCTVDLLGRAGYLEKAYSFVKKMPLWPDASVWGALLGACRISGILSWANSLQTACLKLIRKMWGAMFYCRIYTHVGK
ncbi:hypothetical protein ACSBR2_007228 [Camellia fascicularis]